jgi:uncharacterized Zn finger protein
VLDLQVAAGLVSARVQGSRVRPYRVRLETPVLAAPDWERVEQAMAGRAAFAARLLAGEMPHDIEEAFAAAGVSLFPASPRNLASSCSCPDWSNPCKHVAAVYYLLAEAFDDDPFLIFAWRGRTRGQLLGRLRTLRDGDTSPAEAPRTSEAGGPDPDDGGGLVPPVAAPPLADCLDRFWSAGDLGALRVRPRAAEVPDALLRQLDPPAVDVAGRDLAELLAPAYRILTVAAERRALAEDTG